MFVDLHMHTRFSDGGSTLEEVLEILKNNDIKIAAITDHQNFEWYKKIKDYDTGNIKLIVGMEMDVKYKDYTLHMLLYNFDINNEVINNYLKRNREYEVNNFYKMINSVEEKYQLKMNKEITEEFISNNQYFDKVKLNNLIVAHGWCNDPQKAFYKYTREIKEHKRMSITLDEALIMEKESGGILSLAHPMKYADDINEVKTLILELKEKGLRVVEAINNRQTKEQELELVKFCQDNNLYISGGSDYHAKIGKKESKKIGYALDEMITIDFDFTKLLTKMK